MDDNEDRPPGSAEYSLVKVLRVIQTLDSPVQAIHVNRQRVVLQVPGGERQVSSIFAVLIHHICRFSDIIDTNEKMIHISSAFDV